MSSLLSLAFIVGLFSAGINYAASRLARRKVANIILAVTIAPVCLLWVYWGIELWLAIKTNDMRYFGADMAFVIVTIFTGVFVPASYLGAQMGRFKRKRSVVD